MTENDVDNAVIRQQLIQTIVTAVIKAGVGPTAGIMAFGAAAKTLEDVMHEAVKKGVSGSAEQIAAQFTSERVLELLAFGYSQAKPTVIFTDKTPK